MPDPAPHARPEVLAWKRFCQRIEAMGERLLADDFPNAPADTSEGIAHLADQVSCWLGWSLAHSDTTAPFFHRSNDLATQWGGPNQDNAYHHARIDAGRRYRVRGKMHSCEHFVMTMRVGFMHMKEWGTKKAISSVDLGLRPGDDFEILLGGDGSAPGWHAIPPDVTTLSLREYYVDWKPQEPAVFTIECLDEIPTPPRLDGARVAAGLDHALEQVERSMVGWNEYLATHRAKGRDNVFAPQQTVAKGLSDARYAFLFWDLAPDEVLLIETDVPKARYWGLQLATLGWFEQVDPIHRITSINQHQAIPSADGRVRFVLAHTDPGVPNWLDTGDHREGLLTYRWFWPESDPTPTARVLPLAEIADALPGDTPRVDAAARRAEIAARKAHLAWRFRT
ncbi:MAG: hypothetical protein H6748_19780 [Spirochaetaceae bacterium]|nr:hypothetical protein [Myxococcales bacterium]MCB9726297.1 hypothetical protein [Spirochaetaceae bacterium]HPG24224.1 hypothetical protein [Myxococcota bacterium]